VPRFKYEGQVLEEIVPTVGETRWIEREIGYPLSEWGDAERVYGSFLLSARRAGVMLTWKDVDGMPMGAVEILDDDEPAYPQTPGAEAGATSSSDDAATT
jgi:hypothetical protein